MLQVSACTTHLWADHHGDAVWTVSEHVCPHRCVWSTAAWADVSEGCCTVIRSNNDDSSSSSDLTLTEKDQTLLLTDLSLLPRFHVRLHHDLLAGNGRPQMQLTEKLKLFLSCWFCENAILISGIFSCGGSRPVRLLCRYDSRESRVLHVCASKRHPRVQHRVLCRSDYGICIKDEDPVKNLY